MLSEAQKCKKVVAWSGDFGIDQFISWDLTPEEKSLEVMWQKFEEFCKPQTNEIRARFDLLTSFGQGDHSMDKWYNAVQAQINLAKYPQETARILQRDIFWFFLKDEEFVSRTINDSNIDLEKFPASNVRQLAKKLESSKSTAKYIKQVSNEPYATQIHLLRHQHTQNCHPINTKENKENPNQDHQITDTSKKRKKFDRSPQEQEKYRQEWNKQVERCHKCGDTPHIEGFRHPASRHQCKNCSKTGYFSHLCLRKKQESTYKKSTRNPKAYQLNVGRYSTEDSLYKQEDTDVSESEDSFCLQMQIKKLQADQGSCDTQHLATNFQYKVKLMARKPSFSEPRLTCAQTQM